MSRGLEFEMLKKMAEDANDPGMKGLFICSSYPRLRNIIELSSDLYRQLGASFNRSTNEWKFPSGAVVRFSVVENERSVDRLRGVAYSAIQADDDVPIYTWGLNRLLRA